MTVKTASKLEKGIAVVAGLDQGGTVTLPSADDPQLWAAFDVARVKLFAASQTGKPAS